MFHHNPSPIPPKPPNLFLDNIPRNPPKFRPQTNKNRPNIPPKTPKPHQIHTTKSLFPTPQPKSPNRKNQRIPQNLRPPNHLRKSVPLLHNRRRSLHVNSDQSPIEAYNKFLQHLHWGPRFGYFGLLFDEF